MKTSVDSSVKSSTAAKAKKTNNSSSKEEKPFFAPSTKPSIQTKLKIGSPNDPMEKEADQTAAKVMRMTDSAKAINPVGEKKLQRKTEEPRIQRKSEATASTTTAELGASIANTSGGTPLSNDTKDFMESRFGADFSNVRIHNNSESASMSNQIGAKAFTYGNNIFFNQNQYQPSSSEGKTLLAHELTHTVQQGAAVQRKAAPVTTSVAQPQIQRFLGLSLPSWQDVLDWMAEKAYHIPGFRMFTIVIGSNPINGENADRSAANILRAIVEFLPGGHVITQALDKYNVFEKAGSWVEGQMKRFSGLMGTIKASVKQFMSEIDFMDVVLHPVRTWEKAVAIFSKPVNEIISFIKSIFQAIFQFVRDAVLMPLANLAKGTRGFDLLCAIMGKNPITGETVPRNADTLIGGFMKLIGREDIWENIKKGNAIAKAFAWFQKAMKGLVAMVTAFPAQFIAMLKSLEVMDFIILPNLFKKVFGVFGNFIGAFLDWALNTVFDLLEIIFSVVAPSAMPYLAKVRSSFKSILEKPMNFVKNLVNAAKKGFIQFKDRIGVHFKKALIGWLLGSLKGANLYIPQSFSLKEVIKLALSVFGLTWQNFREKLVKAIGETAVAALETGFDILKTLVTEGPAAAWDKIQDKINELKDQFFAEVTNFVTVTIVEKAITKLLLSLNPAGGFITAILAIKDTIMFLIQKIQQIAQVGMSVINSIVEIASGAIGKAANAVENTLGNLLSLAISFLANLLGLGKISDKVVEIIKKLRAPVDKAMDKLVDWIVAGGKKLLGKIAQTGVPKDPKERLKLGMQKAVGAVNHFAGKKVGKVILDPLLAGIKARYGFQKLDLIKQGTNWAIDGKINPTMVTMTEVTYDDGKKRFTSKEVNITVKYDLDDISQVKKYIEDWFKLNTTQVLNGIKKGRSGNFSLTIKGIEASMSSSKNKDKAYSSVDLSDIGTDFEVSDKKNRRVRPPKKKGQTGEITTNIELKVDDKTWAEVDAEKGGQPRINLHINQT